MAGARSSPIADRHFTFFSNGRFRCPHYDIDRADIRKPMFSGQKRISSLMTGQLSDLGFYTIKMDPYMPMRKRPVNISFLSTYVLAHTPSGKPFFITDDHNHCATVWAMARETMFDRPAALFDFDYHSDTFKVFRMPKKNMNISDFARFCMTSVDITNFIHYSCAARTSFGQVLDGNNIFNIRSELIGTSTDRPNKNSSGSVGFFPTDLSPELAYDRAQRLKDKGTPVIFDIDLDYFVDFFSITNNFWAKDNPQRAIDLPGGSKLHLGRMIEDLSRLADLADVITIATSPDYFGIDDQQRIVNELIFGIYERIR